MTLSDPFRETLRDALAMLSKQAARAQSEDDLSEVKDALNRAWFAIHAAQQACIDGENATRRAALAKLEPAL